MPMNTTPDHRRTAKLVLLYMLVGIIAGLGAIIFQQMLSVMNLLFMEGLTGYTEIKIVTGAQRFELPWQRPELRIWLFPVIAGFGGLISGLIVYNLAPEAAGHGTDEVIDSYHKKDGEVRLRVSLVKTIASAITLGSGGSGGKEGPIAQIGAGFGSFICGLIPYFKDYRKEIMLAGMAAGIAAIFRAPLAGAIFAAEILHSDMEYDGRVIVPAVLSSVVAYGVYALYFGCSPALTIPVFTYRFSLSHLLPFTLIGIISAYSSTAFVWIFYKIRDLFEKLAIKPFLKPCIGGVLTGILCLFVPEAFGEGSFHFEQILNNHFTVWHLSLILIAKIMATSFSIASGGSGGIFGPSLFVGAALGGVFAGIFETLLPNWGIPPAVFMLTGMVAFFAGAANAPISTVIIVSEMTSNFSLLAPFLWVAMFGYIFSQNWNIYENQISVRRGVLEIAEQEHIHPE